MPSLRIFSPNWHSSDGADALANLLRAIVLQGDVVGALVLRELHTRFGRENIGYLWLFGEPLMLASAVGLMHAHAKLGFAGGLETMPFVIGGYCYFMAFRSIVSRAESVIEANRPLLNFRQVTLFDMLLARALLEAVSTIVVMSVLLYGAYVLGIGVPLGRPLIMFVSLVVLIWFSFALSMVVAALAAKSHLFARILHPILYLFLPLSGAFYVFGWLPPGVREFLLYLPLAHIFEISRVGLFADFTSPYINYPYLMFWCLGLSFIGLVLLRRTRRSIHVS